jgi:hypothetical protein
LRASLSLGKKQNSGCLTSIPGLKRSVGAAFRGRLTWFWHYCHILFRLFVFIASVLPDVFFIMIVISTNIELRMESMLRFNSQPILERRLVYYASEPHNFHSKSPRPLRTPHT